MSSQNITVVLNTIIEITSTVIPMQIVSEAPQLVTAAYEPMELSVLIGLTGDLRGRVILDASKDVVQAIAERMYGMALSDEMLESFSAELGNMLAGNMATQLSERKVSLNITPPTVLVGNSKITGFKKAIRVPLLIEDKGKMNFVLILEE